MRNRPRPSLNRSNDGGVALKVLVLKLPNNSAERGIFNSPVFENVDKHGFSNLMHYIHHVLFPVWCSLMNFSFPFSSSSCWISSDNNLIWIFVSFVVVIEVVSETNLKENISLTDLFRKYKLQTSYSIHYPELLMVNFEQRVFVLFDHRSRSKRP